MITAECRQAFNGIGSKHPLVRSILSRMAVKRHMPP